MGRGVVSIGAFVAAGLAVAGLAYTAGARHERGRPPASASSAPAAGDPPGATAPLVRDPSTMAPSSPPLRVAEPAGAAPAAPLGSSVTIPVPLPPDLGGGKPVAPATRAVATRLGLVPEELTDVAQSRGGTLPTPVVKKLDDAYARGVSLAQRLALDATQDEVVGNRFANQLVRIDREMKRSPPSTTLADVIDSVTRDTVLDLRKAFGDEIADAAKPQLIALSPL